jgi:hypothetical protein
MNDFESVEERVIYKERFQGSRLDFRGRPVFHRCDCCESVKAMILVDDTTRSLAITNCVFEDCNIDHLASDETRSLIARNNVFKEPIQLRKMDFERRLADALARRSR